MSTANTEQDFDVSNKQSDMQDQTYHMKQFQDINKPIEGQMEQKANIVTRRK